MIEAVPAWAREEVSHLPVAMPLADACRQVSLCARTLRAYEKRGRIKLMRTAPGTQAGKTLVSRLELARLLVWLRDHGTEGGAQGGASA